MITTGLCDDGNHEACDGEGLVRGTLRPNHEPDHEGRKVWVTVRCTCSCHQVKRVPPLDPEELRIETMRGGWTSPIRVKITHLPTGLMREAEAASSVQAREQALDALREAVHEAE